MSEQENRFYIIETSKGSFAIECSSVVALEFDRDANTTNVFVKGTNKSFAFRGRNVYDYIVYKKEEKK